MEIKRKAAVVLTEGIFITGDASLRQIYWLCIGVGSIPNIARFCRGRMAPLSIRRARRFTAHLRGVFECYPGAFGEGTSGPGTISEENICAGFPLSCGSTGRSAA